MNVSPKNRTKQFLVLILFAMSIREKALPKFEYTDAYFKPINNMNEMRYGQANCWKQ